MLRNTILSSALNSVLLLRGKLKVQQYLYLNMSGMPTD